MRKKFLSLALALALCLSLTIPAMAADRAQSTSSEMAGNYTLVRQGAEANQDSFVTQSIPMIDAMGDGYTVNGYNAVTENTSWTVSNTASNSNVYLEISVELLVRRGDAYDFTTDGVALSSSGNFVDHYSANSYYRLRSGQSISFNMASILSAFGKTASDDAMYLLFIVQGMDGDYETFSDQFYLKPGSTQTAAPAAPAAPAATGTFSDVPDSSPFKDAIEWAVAQSITNGITATTFGPSNTCTVSHILTFLYRAAGSPGASSDERASVSAWAGALGIDAGDLSAPCTRAMAVLYMWLAAGSPEPNGTTAFSDFAPEAPYAKAVAWAVEKGITNGTSDTTFSPAATCTRGQIVTFLYRAK